MGLVNYDTSEDEGEEHSNSKVARSYSQPQQSTAIRNISAAPAVVMHDSSSTQLMLTRESEKSLITNIDYDSMSRPVQGPSNPYNTKALMKKNVITGHAEVQAFNDAYFRQQHQNFSSLGYVRDPSIGITGSAWIGDVDNVSEHQGADAADVARNRQLKRDLKRKRESKGDITQLEGDNVWKGPWAKYENEAPSDTEGLAMTDEEYEPEVLAPASNPIVAKTNDIRIETNHGAERSEYFGKQMYDYLGRTYMHIPQEVDIDLKKESGEQECFVPKKLVHAWEGHKKAITALRFFPSSGHLLLSSSMDSKIMLWDCYHERELLREYSGHSKAVRDISFSPDGTRFLSAGYDSQMKLWDTETGQCISRFSTGKIPYVVKINPDHDKQEFLAGMSDKKIVQYDMKSGEIIQEYDHHLGPVNTLTFIDENRRFVTTSDDKSLRAWEYGIPVPIKLIAEPNMHSMPSVAAHPSGKYIACQSLDNQIVVFSALDKIKAQRRKQFRGHGCSGYGIEVAFSPDGKYLSSGDAGGFACFWDWKTCKMLSKFSAHKGPLTQIAWNPQETSKVATAGNDTVINYWD